MLGGRGCAKMAGWGCRLLCSSPLTGDKQTAGHDHHDDDDNASSSEQINIDAVAVCRPIIAVGWWEVQDAMILPRFAQPALLSFLRNKASM